MTDGSIPDARLARSRSCGNEDRDSTDMQPYALGRSFEQNSSFG